LTRTSVSRDPAARRCKGYSTISRSAARSSGRTSCPQFRFRKPHGRGEAHCEGDLEGRRQASARRKTTVAAGLAPAGRRAGTAWTRITLPAISTIQAWYDWYVAATPDKPGEVYLGAIDTFRGTLVLGKWQWRNITIKGDLCR